MQTLLLWVLLVVAVVSAHDPYTAFRRDGREEPASSYASFSTDFRSHGTRYGDHSSAGTGYGPSAPSYGGTQNMYGAPAPMMYGLVPKKMMEEEEKMEEDKKQEKGKPMTKQEKKCAVKKVLPPLIIITIFIGLILLHLVAPTLLPAFVDPFVDPLVAVVNAITGQANGRHLHAYRTPSAFLDGAFDPLMEATERVSAALSNGNCFASLLCEAATAAPIRPPALRVLRSLVPERYHGYLDILATTAGKCDAKYPCPLWSGNGVESNHV